jgi:hypothetical protein
MIGRPLDAEAPSYLSGYIGEVAGDDPVAIAGAQLEEALRLFEGISEESSLHRYTEGKWSIREMLNHVTDTERSFAYRILWFARGFTAPMPGYDQDIGVAGAEADAVSWAAHVEEFRLVRLATISLLRNLPAEGWKRSGSSTSGSFYTVRALAFVTSGHVAHHLTILRERYLRSA